MCPVNGLGLESLESSAAFEVLFLPSPSFLTTYQLQVSGITKLLDTHTHSCMFLEASGGRPLARVTEH